MDREVFYRVTKAWVLSAWLLICITGCPKEPTVDEPALPLEGITQKVLVVDDSAIAQSIGRLKTEWKAVSGAELQIREISTAELSAQDKLSADLIIYPSSLLGELVERQKLSPLSARSLENTELVWGDIFDSLRSHEATWGEDVYALPLGSPVFCLVYRADILERLGLQPPKTWKEYQVIADALHVQAEKTGDKSLSILEPLAKEWAGKVLLARAAAYAKHKENYSALFRIDTFEPLIAGPPFVRALEELARAYKEMPEGARETSPQLAMNELLAGRAAMAISWASSSERDQESSLPNGTVIAFAALPGSDDVFQVSNQKWETRSAEESWRVPLTSIAGRLASVTHECEVPEGAFRLAAWLSGPRWSAQVSASSKQTTLYRNSHLKAPQDWTESVLDATASLQYAETVQSTLSVSNVISALRIPGEAEYMQALDTAAAAVLDEKVSAAEALNDAATRWKEISIARGIDEQRQAYQRSLGLSP